MSSKYDDERKLGRPLAKPKDAGFKSGKKTQVSKDHGSSGKSVFQGGTGVNPMSVWIAAESKGHKRKQPKVDPYMVRMAKLQAAKKVNQNEQ